MEAATIEEQVRQLATLYATTVHKRKMEALRLAEERAKAAIEKTSPVAEEPPK